MLCRGNSCADAFECLFGSIQAQELESWIGINAFNQVACAVRHMITICSGKISSYFIDSIGLKMNGRKETNI